MAPNPDRKRMRQLRKQIIVKRQELSELRAEFKELNEKLRDNKDSAEVVEELESSVI